MAENTAMPLWLDIKKEYIDENLEGVLSYLHKRVRNTELQDSFYLTTITLLEERVKALVQTIAAAPLQYRAAPSGSDPVTPQSHGRTWQYA